jgi:hypothetical protein
MKQNIDKNYEKTDSDPRYCIAAHVPAIKAPGLAELKHVSAQQVSKDSMHAYREPERLGLA